MSKTQTQETEMISFCDVMKENTSKIIKKLEMQVPISIQAYSDFYKSYLHSLDDIFGTCYIAEKQLVDRMGFDQNFLKNFQKMSDDITSMIETQIDMMNNMQKAQLEIRSQLMKASEHYVHFMMDSYAKYLSFLNTGFKSE
jgi:hypothetical protein